MLSNLTNTTRRRALICIAAMTVIVSSVSLWTHLRELDRERQLFDAVRSDDTMRVTRLLDDGVVVNARWKVSTPPTWVLQAEALVGLNRGKCLTPPGMDGDTPLMFCARSNNPLLLKLLLEHGADRTAINRRGLSARDMAAILKIPGVFDQLAPPRYRDMIAGVKQPE